MEKQLTLEDLATMVKEGFTDIEQRMATKDDFKTLLEELNATHTDVRYVKRTVGITKS
mgnify:FL=1